MHIKAAVKLDKKTKELVNRLGTGDIAMVIIDLDRAVRMENSF